MKTVIFMCRVTFRNSTISPGGLQVTPEKDSICLVYKLGEVGNVVHLLLCCLVYENIRHIYFSKMSSNAGSFIWIEDYDKPQFSVGQRTLAKYLVLKDVI